MSYAIEIQNVTKVYPDLQVLNNLGFYVEQGEFVSIIGPSGCGKSTIFKLITGLEKDYAGLIRLNNRDISAIETNVSYMPQKDLLLPWKTVIDNIELPLKINGTTISNEELASLVDLFGLKGFEQVYPKQLSGGMRQRAALLRTMLMGNDIVLLDEPFGAIDSINRLKLQKWLLDVFSKLKRSVLFITHDIDEAILLSDKIIVLSNRPASIVGEMKIEFPVSRDETILTTNRFNKYKRKILQLLNT